MYNPENNKIEGFMQDMELVWLYDCAKECKCVAEVGSWMGRSAHALLEACEGSVFCVDHFKGSAEELDSAHQAAKTQDIFSIFQRNVGHYPNLVIMHMNSLEAAKRFEDNELDMVFIDGSHTYENARADIEAWLPKTKYLCGHDYHQASIPKIAEDTGLNLVPVDVGSLWELRKEQ